MKILISGAKGFIGRNLLDCLTKTHEIEVHILSTSATKKDREIYSDFNFINLNEDFSNAFTSINEIKPEILIHLGWKGIPDYSVQNSLDSLKWSIKISNLAIKSGVKRIISTGSCWEYLNPEGAINESWPLDRSNAFKLAKNIAREYISLMCEEANIDFVWLRLFYVYGKYQNEHSLIPSLLKQIKMNIAPVAKNYDASLDFVDASYVAQIILFCIKKNKINGIFNVGSGCKTQVLEIVNSMRKIFNYPIIQNQTNYQNNQNFYSANEKILKLINLKAPNIIEDLNNIIKNY